MLLNQLFYATKTATDGIAGDTSFLLNSHHGSDALQAQLL